MVAARDKFLSAKTSHFSDDDVEAKEDEICRLRGRLVVLGSSGTHSATKKAAQILGVRYATVDVSEGTDFAMKGSDLAGVLNKLEQRGLEPFFLTATLGTFEVCAVDDFAGIAKSLESRANTPNEIWVHVDAAYAGIALVLDEYIPLATPFEYLHSFNANPQKWLVTTFGCSALWIRGRAHLIESSLSVKPPYLRSELSEGSGVVDYRDWQIPLGRRFRSLKLWFVMRAYGVRCLQVHVRRGIELGESLETKMRSRSDLFDIFTPAHFGLLTLRSRGGKDNDQFVNAQTRSLCKEVNSSGRFLFSDTTISGKCAIRVCTSGASLREEHMDDLFDFLVERAEEIISKWRSDLISRPVN